ncbi:hypothetical protein TCAL_06865 [Tigriopus californicus]|uniref:MICAL-like protein 1 n=1 Tax=Tigriopus californicus TaxID=6832 RepID=A0A553NEH3_TIGCA|nr:hypothetical protein TCAL_06865 [Tigriopus californicus]
MAFLEGTKALEKWCKVVTADYESVNIVNMSTSWRNGLGFCAIIHHFRPELIDFESLDEDDILGNNILAFSVGEQHLSIPALLDPQDMVECELLDRLSILTYLSQFYQAFHGATAPSTGKAKRTGSSRSSSATSSPVKSLATSKMPMIGRRNEPCKMCGKVVFILERLNVTGKLLHRTCFKCARCGTQLNIVNYYETEKGDYCCDVCPDEETNQEKVVEANKRMVSEHLDSGLENSSSESEDEDNNNSNGYVDSGGHSTCPKTESDGLDNHVASITKNLDENLNVTPKPKASCLPNENETCQNESSKQQEEGKTEVVSDQQGTNDNHTENGGQADGGEEEHVALDIKEPSKVDDEDVISNIAVQSNVEVLNAERDLAAKALDINDDSRPEPGDAISASNNANESENVPLPLLTRVEDNMLPDADETTSSIRSDEANKPQEVKENMPCKMVPPEPFTESVTEHVTEPETEPETKVTSEPETEPITELVTEVASEPVTEAGIEEDETEVVSEPVTKTGTKDETEVVSEPVTEAGTEDAIGDATDVADYHAHIVSVPTVLIERKAPEVIVEDVTLEQSKSNLGQDNEETQKVYPGEMNPFGDEDENEQPSTPQEKPDKESKPEDTSTNPFGSDFEDSDDEKPNKLVTNVSKPEIVTTQGPLANNEPPPKPPRINASLNPFGSDFEEEDDDEDSQVTYRSSRSGSLRSPSPTPSSASSMRSRKKRKAPKPPGASSTPIASPRTSVVRAGPVPSPRGLTPRAASPTLSVASTVSFHNKTRPAPPPPRPPPPKDLPKQRKDQDNQKRRSQMIETGSISSECSSVTQTSGAPSIILTPLSPDKAIEGQWKKKKGPAPPRPIPQKRQVKKIPRKAVNTELHDIEIKQQELERQGVKLEKTIRELCDRNDRERCEQGLDITDRDSLGPEVEDLIIQLFDLVNEKNDLFRRQTELIYMKRDHRLEEEHADIEHQIRLLMVETQKSDEDKAREDKLITRLMEIMGLEKDKAKRLKRKILNTLSVSTTSLRKS